MPKVIVKSGRLCVSGGRLVTDAEGAPCVCGGGGPTYDCDNLPPCLNVRIDGIQVLYSCENTKSPFCPDPFYISEISGHTGRDYVIPRLGNTSAYSSEIPARLVIIDPCFGVFASKTSIRVDAVLDCQNGRLVVSSFGNIWDRMGGGIVGEVVFSAPKRIPPYEFGETVGNWIEEPLCTSIGLWGPFGGGTGSVTIPDQCHDWRWADACEGATQPQSVAYDALTIIPGSSTLVNPDNDARYTLTERFAEDPGPTPEYIYSTDDCGGNPTWPVAVACNGSGSISYDPATIAPGSVTLLWQGARYAPSATTTTQPPVPAVGSPDPCPPPPGGLCDGLVPNDIRCNDPLYRNCPQCAGFDIGDPDPRPTNQGQGGKIPGLGDMVAEAIRVISLNTLLPCGACERRKQVLNRFGERAGRAIIRRLGW